MDEQVKKKLRYQEGQAAVVINAPEGYGLVHESAGADALEGSCDFVQLYVNSAAEVEERLPEAIALLKEDAIFWITYPKQSPKLKPDINRDTLASMVVDSTAYRPVSNVAVDEKWSALRFREKAKVKSQKA